MMKNLKDTIQQVYVRELPTTKNAVAQSHRNQLRGDLVNALLADLNDCGVVSYLTSEGIILEVSHEDLGSVCVSVKVTVKGLDYDLQGAINELQEKQEKKKEKDGKKNDKQ